MRLAIDGTAPELIHVILETELSELAERHKTGQEFFKDLGLNWIAFGFIGSMAVIAFRSHSAESLSSLAAVAALPLFYSFVFAGLIAFPFRRKLARRSQEEILQKRMILTGIAALQIGDNPRIVEQKLTRYVASKDRYVED